MLLFFKIEIVKIVEVLDYDNNRNLFFKKKKSSHELQKG